MTHRKREVSNDMAKIEITTRTEILKATQIAGDLAKRIGLSQADQSKVQIAVSELANNILDHARGKGNIAIDTVTQRGRVGIIVIAEDKGPGIIDIDRALHKPNSSATGLGIGLGAVERLMSEFRIERANDQGTRVTAVKWKI